ncbi:kinase-like protein [Aureobasidium sp. EXF-8845]|nr:kinase-like protein [Aureobasidium sp. EXF-8845]KAI4842192.1 kinase-like protein [Aureobasidium sp. EXF-8846]
MDTSPTHHVDFNPSDVRVLQRLASGTSSHVWLAEKRDSGELYALKILRKDVNYDTTAQQSLRSNISALRKQRSNFILGLSGSLRIDDRDVLITQYMPGGDLESYISRNGPLDSAVAQFYAAELCQALFFIHRCGVIHRNIGLEHMLLDVNGHIRLTGFGVCKDGMWDESKTTTFCGGLALAPEILLDLPYDRAVDWWGFGLSLFEMVEATHPFRGQDEDSIHDEILDDDKPSYPPQMPQSTKSILQQLLLRDPSARLGADADAILAHEFFAGISWKDISHEQMEAPLLLHCQRAAEVIKEEASAKPALAGEEDNQNVFLGF